MASSTRNSIIVEWPFMGGPKFKEALAGDALITPGEVIDFDGSGDVIVNAQPVGTQPVQKMVALEAPTADTSSASAAIDQAYADGDTVRYIVPPRGTVLNMWLKDGESVIVGTPLGTSSVAGVLAAITEAATIHEEAIIGYAAEVLAPSGADARCLVEIA